jgi:dihydroflavonol-4-reductase
MIFVTGGTGLVGSYLIKALVQEGAPVRALCRHPYEGPVLTPAELERVEWIQGDILDAACLENAMEGVTQVYHCAAMVSFNPRRQHILFQVNIEGTANVVNAALEKGVQKMVHVSSVAALGGGNGRIDESMSWNEESDNSRYGKSKFHGEMEVWRGIAEGLHAVIVNPALVLGAGDWEKSSAELFKTAYDEFGWYTDGINGMVDVRDVVRAMILLMNSPINAERFILSADNWTFLRLFSEMATAFGKRIPHKKVTPFLAGLIWRAEKVRGLVTGKDPLITKETARTAQALSYYDAGKITATLDGFSFTPLEESIRYHAAQLTEYYKLERSITATPGV